MKKGFRNIAFCSFTALAFTACNNQPKLNDTASDNTSTKTTSATSSTQKFAYVEIDSIMSQYNYWKDVKKMIKAKEANIQRTLSNKQKALQAAAANFQQNLQANKYTQAQAQQIQASIQKQAQDAEALQQRLGAEYQSEIAKYNKALSDSVHNYLRVFNKNRKYSIVFAKSGDNLLYVDPAYNITNDIIKGLNQEYKGLSK